MRECKSQARANYSSEHPVRVGGEYVVVGCSLRGPGAPGRHGWKGRASRVWLARAVAGNTRPSTEGKSLAFQSLSSLPDDGLNTLVPAPSGVPPYNRVKCPRPRSPMPAKPYRMPRARNEPIRRISSVLTRHASTAGSGKQSVSWALAPMAAS